MSDERQANALDFLASIIPSQALESTATARETLASGSIPRGWQVHAEAAAIKVAEGKQLNEAESFALEAIIIPDKRPAVLIQGGDFVIDNASWKHIGTDAAKSVLKPAIAAICRVEIPGHPSLPYAGTGFLVGQNLLMTNRHVAEIFSSGLGRRSISLIHEMKTKVDFLREAGSDEKKLFQVAKVVMVHPYWDMALLRIEDLPQEHPRLRLSLRAPEDMFDQDIVVVGYPASDPRNPPDVLNQVFGGVFQVKRLQPGKIGGSGATARFVRYDYNSYDKLVPTMLHNASTLGGNSGSAILDPVTGDVIGLHFAGEYLKFNCGVPAFELGKDARVVDAGVTFRGKPKTQAGPFEEYWSSVERSEAESAPEDGAGQPHTADAERGSARRGSATADSPDATVRIAVPLEIAIRLGKPSLPSGIDLSLAAEGGEATTERLMEPVHDENYSDRKGYDPDFLAVHIPLPVVTDPQVLSKLDDGRHILDYEHFSLAMHRKRRLAVFTAANVDGSEAAKRPRGTPKGRKAIAGMDESDQERWFTDPRIPALHQLPDRFFNQDRKAFDKGHLVRRDDVAWGQTFKELQRANGDSFHVTNCSPQVAGFNRARKLNWGALENLVDTLSAVGLVSLFSGPVLKDSDREFHGVDEDGKALVKIPTEYWKVVAAIEGSKLNVYAFILKQDTSGVRYAEAIPDKWAPLMVALSELEKRVPLVKFAPILHKADQFATSSGEAVRIRSGIEAVRPEPGSNQRSRRPHDTRLGPKTFRDPVLSLFQSATAGFVRSDGGASRGTTENLSDGSNFILDAEQACQERIDGREGVVADGRETLNVAERGALCARLGLQLLTAQLMGNTAAANEIEQQMIGSTCDARWAKTLKEYVATYSVTGNPDARIYVKPKDAGNSVISIPANAKLALFGDWGTGAQPARQILEHVKARHPDILLHLGDIYYSGTPDECRDNFEAIVDGIFNRGNKTPAVYTLCGNHDMYSGGKGYYDLIRRLNKANATQKASFFCLRAEDNSWQVLAMDTGRNDYSPFSVNHAVTFVDPEEEAWLVKRVKEFKGKTILVSHHPMFSAFSAPGPNGSAINPNLKRLYDRLVAAGGDIPAWFWGHEHNLCVYESYAGLKYGRCIGHGAVPVFSADEPYAVAAGMLNPPPLKPGTQIATLGDYYAHGFAILTLNGTSASVEYYQDRHGILNCHTSEAIS
jgi:DNA/RNA endonuclease G (NUC1)